MTSPLRIVFLLPTMAGGGAEANVLTMLEHLDRDRFDPVLVLLDAEGRLLDQVPDRVPVYDLDDYDSPVIGSLPLGGPLLSKSRALSQLYTDVGGDVLVTNLQEATIAGWISEVLSGRSIPRIAIENNEPERTLARRCPPGWKRQLYKGALRRAFRSSDRVVTVSEGVKEAVGTVLGLSGSNIVSIHNPVPLTTIRRKASRAANLPWEGEAPFLMAAGRLVHQKGFDLLLQAFALVRDEVGRDVQLVIAGEGPERSDLEALADDLGLTGSVHFPGYLSPPFPYMHRASLFVLSSRWEGFGNVLVEAMAVGTPVVSTDCRYGPAEIIDDGESGLLVPPEDPEALATAVVRVLETPTLAERLARKGKERSGNFDAPRVVARYERLFEAVAEQGA